MAPSTAPAVPTAAPVSPREKHGPKPEVLPQPPAAMPIAAPAPPPIAAPMSAVFPRLQPPLLRYRWSFVTSSRFDVESPP